MKRRARSWQGVVAAVLLSVAALAGAQDGFPAPATSYPDADAAAVRPQVPSPQDRKARRNLEKVLRLNPGNVPARVLNAWALLQERGAPASGYDAFESAIAAAPAGSLALRHAHWNYAWALFSGAQTTRAMEHWQAAAQLHGGNPSWVPITFALGLWLTGHNGRAIEYYQAAVNGDPDRWGEAAGVAEATRTWGTNEKLAIEAVHAAWRRKAKTDS